MVKTPHQFEFENLIEFLNDELSKAQIQDITVTDRGVVIHFYRFNTSPAIQFLIFDMDSVFPFLGLYDQNPWARLKTAKPMGLFLKAHFVHAKLERIECVKELGRVARFYFNLDNFVWELQLLPRQPNLLVQADDKKISWAKPKSLQAVAANTEWAEGLENRSIPFLLKQWWDLSSQSGKVSKKSKDAKTNLTPMDYASWLARRQSQLEKKQKALEQINEKLKDDSAHVLSLIGEHLKTFGYEHLPEEWLMLVDQSQMVSQSIEDSFRKAKAIEAKKEGTRKRFNLLLEEINELKQQDMSVYQKEIERKAQQKVYSQQRKNVSGEFRKLVLDADKNLMCYLGKSAADNLKLLRQAKAWDLWIHLKDYPSSHGVIFRNRDQKISDEMIIQSCQWLIKESLRTSEVSQGQRIAVVIVECRHVRPIKGDKVGRVTYHHPREILITV